MNKLSNLKYYAIVLVLLNCHSHEIIQDSNKIFQCSQASDSLSFYFPELLNYKSNKPTFDNYEQNWYSSSLYSFKEPILKNKAGDVTIYRFLWLRSFNQTVCYSIKIFNDDYFLNTKTLYRTPNWYQSIDMNTVDGKEVYDTIKADRLANILFNETIKISKSEWNKFQSLLKESNFWSLPSIDRSDGSTDGSEWVFEGFDKKRYHFVIRHNAHELRASGTYLIKLSNLKVPVNDIY